MFSGNKPGELLACKAAGGGLSIGDPMTLHDFVQWCHDNGFDIASTTIDHGTARIELSCGWADNAEGRLPLSLDDEGDGGGGTWSIAQSFVDKFGGWARWFGADVVMRLDDGPTISIRTLAAPMSDERPRRRYPETKDLPWPPTDDEPTSQRRLMGAGTWRTGGLRPDFMSLTDYHGDA